jgi:hypothetical protein
MVKKCFLALHFSWAVKRYLQIFQRRCAPLRAGWTTDRLAFALDIYAIGCQGLAISITPGKWHRNHNRTKPSATITMAERPAALDYRVLSSLSTAKRHLFTKMPIPSRQSVDAFLQDCLLHDGHPMVGYALLTPLLLHQDLEAAVSTNICRQEFTDWLQVACFDRFVTRPHDVARACAVQSRRYGESTNGIFFFLRQVSLGCNPAVF